jgi:hypothetical protein
MHSKRNQKGSFERMTHKFGHIEPWWDDSFKNLDYQYGVITNTWDEERWRNEGYVNITLNGAAYSMYRGGEKLPMPDSSSLRFFSFIWFKVVSSETIKFFDCLGKAVEKIRYREM